MSVFLSDGFVGPGSVQGRHENVLIALQLRLNNWGGSVSDNLYQSTVLVLNRNWQAVNTCSPAEAFCQMASNAARGLDIESSHMFPVEWEDWLLLPIREQDQGIGTVNGGVRIPAVIVLSRYDKIPLQRPKLSNAGIKRRDQNRCQYTGKLLRPGEATIDHIMPRSRGGTTTWENCVLADAEVNRRKADRTPEEAGLKLLREPKKPTPMPMTMVINNSYNIPEWGFFLFNEGRAL